MVRRILLPLALAVVLPSCKEKGNTASTDEVIRAMGGTRFEVKLPADCKPTDVVGLAFRHADGKIEHLGGSTGYQPNQIVAVYYFSHFEGKPSYSLVSEKGVCRGCLDLGQIGITSSSPAQKPRNVEECLIRFSRDQAVSDSQSRPGEDDFDLILAVKSHI